MYIEKRKISQQEIKRISFIVNIIIVAVFIWFFFSYWNIQVLKNQYYSTLATRNFEKIVEIRAPRGLILDRHKNRMSENTITFNLFLVREYSRDLERSILAAARFTDMSSEDVRKNISKYMGFPKSYEIPIKKNLPLKKVIFIESRSDEYPEFEIRTEPARAYPYQDKASHILGYISEITTGEMSEKSGQGYKMGDLMGKSGIEKVYEEYLRGVNGQQVVIKDNLGKVQSVLREELPTLGRTVILTIDMNLQHYVEQLMASHRGAIGVVELKTGGLLAMVSKPNFSPDFFTGTMDPNEWLNLIHDPDKPLQNKFLQGLYLPGSTFKVVMALAALQENEIDTATISLCSGEIKIYDRIFHCWNRGGHGAANVYEALSESCNVFFYRLGKKMDIDTIAHYAKMLGLGEKTNIDLTNEKRGLFPTKAWKQSQLKQKWFPGETISVAIGGGVINVTPAQLLTIISTVALRGKIPQLHLMMHIEDNGRLIKTFPSSFKTIPIAPHAFETVIEGLYRCVNDNGTGRAAKIDGKDVCGKTGTQLILSLENPNYKQLVKQKRFQPHSWFISFAPRYNPQYAMVVFIENGGDAGAIAAPIAGKIYKKLFFQVEE